MNDEKRELQIFAELGDETALQILSERKTAVPRRSRNATSFYSPPPLQTATKRNVSVNRCEMRGNKTRCRDSKIDSSDFCATHTVDPAANVIPYKRKRMETRKNIGLKWKQVENNLDQIVNLFPFTTQSFRPCENVPTTKKTGPPFIPQFKFDSPPPSPISKPPQSPLLTSLLNNDVGAVKFPGPVLFGDNHELCLCSCKRLYRYD